MIEPNKTPAVAFSRINFQRVDGAGIAVLPSLLARSLPGRRIDGHEYVARNPRRADDRNPSLIKFDHRSGQRDPENATPSPTPPWRRARLGSTDTALHRPATSDWTASALPIALLGGRA